MTITEKLVKTLVKVPNKCVKVLLGGVGTDSPAAQVGDGGQVVENKRQRGHVYRQPLTFRTLQLETQDPLKRAKVTPQEVMHKATLG